MIIYGQHRSLKLAEKHRQKLARKYNVEVEITARLNSKGQFSKRGHFFTFEIKKQNREYLLVFEYPRVKRSAGFHVDVFVIGPDGSKITQLIDIIKKHIDDPWWLEIAIEAYIEAEGELTNEKETAEQRSFIRI